MTCLENVTPAWKWADPDWCISEDSDLWDGDVLVFNVKLSVEHAAIGNQLIYSVFVTAVLLL